MDMKDLAGVRIKHNIHGKGTIISNDDHNMKVRFEKEGVGEKCIPIYLYRTFFELEGCDELTKEDVQRQKDSLQSEKEKKETEGLKEFEKNIEEKRTSSVREIRREAQPSIPRNVLHTDDLCGTNAERIYEDYAPVFGFTPELSRKFGFQRDNYAMDATKEHIGVWFIMYSNLNPMEDGNFYNEIKDDHIIEHWKTRDITEGEHIIGELRLVFARTRNGHAFQGVYKCLGLRGDVVMHERVSEIYPMEKDE